jgi:creatinine amidohydrolase/Fe(II)-dependent formamide hydrolase-like protein
LVTYVRILLIVLGALQLATAASAANHPRILELAELNTEQIRSLDREKTVILIPGGILEQHGPYLPTFSDGYMNEWTTDLLARAVVARPGWTAVILPIIPLGTGGANEIGGQFTYPGTYTVRSNTLRAVFVDLATELGDQGFRWIFVVHIHGAPMHSRALDEAGEYFRDIYGGRMVHLFGLLPVFLAGAPPRATDAVPDLDVHAGQEETSDLLFLRPDLVAPGYRTAPSLIGADWPALMHIARSPDWPGYFSAPSQANPDQGQATQTGRSRAAADYMLRILDGADERDFPHYAAILAGSPSNVEIDRAAAERERVREDRFTTWLSKRQVQVKPPSQ